MEKADVKDYPLSISILEQAGQALSSHAEGLSVTSGNYYYSVLELAYSYYNAALNVAYLTGRKEESEVVRSLYNKRALTLLQLGKGDKALKDAEKILNAIYRMQQHGKDVKIQDVGIVGFIYLATGRFAEARKLFRTLLSGKDNTSTVGDRLLFIADTYKLAGINSQVREYLSLARRYYQIGIREHQKTLGRNNPLCLRAVSELNEVDKLISTTDKQTIENKIDI